MYVVVAEFRLRPEAVAEFGPLMDKQAKDSVELEEACRQFDVCQSKEDPAHFLLYEFFDDEAAFEKHRKLPHTAKFLEKAASMGAAPEIRRFNLRAANRGR